jgi:hypothetical protein
VEITLSTLATEHGVLLRAASKEQHRGRLMRHCFLPFLRNIIH